MTMIKCTICDGEFELTEALSKDIEKSLLTTERAKHAAELEKAKNEAEESKTKAIADLTEKANKEATEKLELKIQEAHKEAEESKKESRELKEELTKVLQQLRESNKAKENAELDMQKKLNAETTKIEEEATKRADDKYQLKMAEKDKKLADTQKALSEAQRKAEQGSQQTQGEVLELELENRLREEFPSDEIEEVKKGQRGADIKQIVRNHKGESCGIILWETKNGKWQPSWIAKFKQDIRTAGANIGVLVSQEIPPDIGDMKHAEGSVWVVSPKLAVQLAVALRATILQVFSANTMSANKDQMMESLYQFLVGPEFKHRVEAMIESYTTLQNEIEKEKRSYALKWSRQEKALRSVIDNTIGMYGDLQGITNRALPVIKTLELKSGEEDIIEDEDSEESVE
jgi:hypothetical protein